MLQESRLSQRAAEQITDEQTLSAKFEQKIHQCFKYGQKNYQKEHHPKKERKKI